MLNAYHLKFLHRFVEQGIAFLVIGGQARHFLDPDHRTEDLDLWVRISPEDTPKLDALVDGWVREHPQHAATLGSGRQWRANVQVHFPDGDGVLFLDHSHNLREVNAKDGIDVLTSLHDRDFNECMSRAYRNEVDGMTIRSLCPYDLERSQQA